MRQEEDTGWNWRNRNKYNEKKGRGAQRSLRKRKWGQAEIQEIPESQK